MNWWTFRTSYKPFSVLVIFVYFFLSNISELFIDGHVFYLVLFTVRLLCNHRMNFSSVFIFSIYLFLQWMFHFNFNSWNCPFLAQKFARMASSQICQICRDMSFSQGHSTVFTYIWIQFDPIPLHQLPISNLIYRFDTKIMIFHHP